MKFIIISDLHLGDTNSTLVFRDPADKVIKLGSKYESFKNAAGTGNDYLVLLGDVLDFSIASYYDAYDIGRFFFNKVKDDNIAREIIYVPGNHDFDLWNTIEYQVNIINKFSKGGDKNKDRLPEPFRHSVPGVIDLRGNAVKPGFTIPGVTERTEQDAPRYAGLFLDYITEPPTPFNFVYPNIYVITDTETLLVTHGHYLEDFWSCMDDYAVTIAGSDLKNDNGDVITQNNMRLKDVVAINFLQCSLACSSIGQAGPLTRVIAQQEHAIIEKKFDTIKKYLDRITGIVMDTLGGSAVLMPLKKTAGKLVSSILKKFLIDKLSGIEKTRYSREFMDHKEVRRRLIWYYIASFNEIVDLNEKYHLNIPAPETVIFGHTHQPIAWGDKKNAPAIELAVLNNKKLYMYNTGGWLMKDEKGKKEFCGADIFKYESGAGFSSIRIS